MYAHLAWLLLMVAYPLPTCLYGAYGTRNKAASAVVADVTEDVVHAVCAERAFIGTDHGVGSFWWQVAITALAVWS